MVETRRLYPRSKEGEGEEHARQQRDAPAARWIYRTRMISSIASSMRSEASVPPQHLSARSSPGKQGAVIRCRFAIL